MLVFIGYQVSPMNGYEYVLAECLRPPKHNQHGNDGWIAEVESQLQGPSAGYHALGYQRQH